jgi:hypothetical protein
MLAAAPSPRGSDADLSIVGYVVGGSMTSRCLHAMPPEWPGPITGAQPSKNRT